MGKPREYKNTESPKKASIKWQSRISLNVSKIYHEELKKLASNSGMTLSGYIKQAIDEKIERDGVECLNYGAKYTRRQMINFLKAMAEKYEENAQNTKAKLSEDFLRNEKLSEDSRLNSCIASTYRTIAEMVEFQMK